MVVVIGQGSCQQESVSIKGIKYEIVCKFVNGGRKDVVLLTGIGEKAFKNFQLLVIQEEAKGLRQGGEGFTGIVEITPLARIIQDQISEVSSMEPCACNLTENF